MHIINQLIERIENLINHQDDRILLSELAAILNDIKNQDLFLFSYLRDSIIQYNKIIDSNKHTHEKLNSILNVILKRLLCFDNWIYKDNKTIALIQNGQIAANEIKPFLRMSKQQYDEFYRKQNVNLEKKLKGLKHNNNSELKSVPIDINSNITQSYRKIFAVHSIEFVMGLIDSNIHHDSLPLKWVDIGCGAGFISNAVNPKTHSKQNWDIYGCDLQESRIAIAKNRAAKNKNYLAIDAFTYLQQMKIKNQSVDLVSMLEFCEHFQDPFDLISKVAELDVSVIVIGTPLNQKLNSPFNDEQDVVHLWGFSKNAMVKMIEAAGFQVITSNETYIGKYLKNDLNWLTVVAAKPEFVKNMKKSFHSKI